MDPERARRAEGNDMGWFSRRERAVSPTRATRDYIAPKTDAGPPWVGRALRLPVLPTPAAAAELAGRAADAAREVSGVELDYSPDSLEYVDAMLEVFREPGSDVMAESIFLFGCYIGEVLVRNAGYVWVDTPDHLAQHLGTLTVYHPGTGAHANPISKAFKRVDYGKPDNLPYFYRVYAAG
ncbi:hypothetical protein [Mycobacterium asiaticum]|uniref:hypothetical protein n=1 Tax=Mycobacterium asiaticum TaxID=1790 RepID=UPI001FD39DFA|nr:hypothetical protein [Mycobacterium asiaticum]